MKDLKNIHLSNTESKYSMITLGKISKNLSHQRKERILDMVQTLFRVIFTRYYS